MRCNGFSYFPVNQHNLPIGHVGNILLVRNNENGDSEFVDLTENVHHSF